MSKERKTSTKSYLCKIEPVPTGWEHPDMMKFIEDQFAKVRKIQDRLLQKANTTKLEDKDKKAL